MKLMYLCVAVGDEHIVWFVQAPRPGTELFLSQLGEGQGGGGGDHQHHEGQGGHLDPGDSNQKPGTSLTRLIMQSRIGKDESRWAAGANCGGWGARASKRSLEPALATLLLLLRLGPTTNDEGPDMS